MAVARSIPESAVSDETLVQRVCDGDRSAFDLLYDRYFPRVYGFVNRRLRNRPDTEETVQEVFVNVFSSLASFRGDAPFSAWTLGVARRTVASRFKKKQHPTVPLEDTDGDEGNGPMSRLRADGDSPLDHYEAVERARRMSSAAYEELTDEQRLLFEMHHLEHRSVRDIARDLHKSEDAVKSHLYRARKVLLAR